MPKTAKQSRHFLSNNFNIMKSKVWLLVIAAGIIACQGLHAQKLDKFGADMGKKSVMGKEIRIPYTDVTSYYGYIQPGSKPDEERDGKNYYYLYVWIPAAAPELGVRMVSPVPAKLAPEKTDYVAPEFTANASDTKN